MAEGTQIYLLPVSTSDSSKEVKSTSSASPNTQDSSQLSQRLLIEKQQEEAEWENINTLLMTYGLKPLCLVKRMDLKDLIVFDKQSSQRMRQNLKVLMEETSRQQKMIQELIDCNQQLKNDLQLEQNRADHQEQRANDLEEVMEGVKSKIGELEDESLNRVCQQQSKIKELQKEQRALQMKCQHYKKKRVEQQEIITSLQKEMCRLRKEEEERVITQNRVFSYLCRRVPHSILDRQLLCLIDYYESKLRKINSQRPTQHELRLYKQQVKKLEKALKKSVKLQELISPKKTEDTERKDMPSKENHQPALVDQRYFQVLCSINSIIHNPRTPVIIYKQSKGGAPNFNKDLVQDCGFEHLIPIIEMWADELTSLKDLYKTLKMLSAELVPWHNFRKQSENEGVRVEDLLLMVDTMLEEVENKDRQDSKMPNLQMLHAIVSHFQKLFDVPSLNGVYPRMNEVYTRLGEMSNAVRNLQELLNLDSSSSLCVLVSTVGRLCRLLHEDVKEQVKRVLGPEDLQSIISKLEEHEEFFPAFQAFINDLLQVLEIDDLDAIVPAIRKLKVLSY
ncbi:PREDICTED: centrosomal protein of 70 kDa [Dipodomys ordii]|uniref:Centrosomal protein of 70 kDa n=1 Tax=Dipodomys ordii TaxID=10020 RepID=A0A1S3GQ85_DIPOR|nr:PREDICTED: centrosomal protein of 70 kDa [Dipodomys ordii]